MCDEWMRGLQLFLSLEEFHQLPRHPAFRYEYFSGKVYISPRPRHYHALLDLEPSEPPLAGVRVQPVSPSDWELLIPTFAGAFATVQPFAGLSTDLRREAATQCLTRTRSGGDGPWIAQASRTAWDGEHLVGALLVTLLPNGDPCSWDCYQWDCEPPPSCVELRLGQPHLTWVFVSPQWSKTGVATALLAAAKAELLALGYTQLLSTFLLGNEASALWHWRCGFRLLPYPGSIRTMRSTG